MDKLCLFSTRFSLEIIYISFRYILTNFHNDLLPIIIIQKQFPEIHVRNICSSSYLIKLNNTITHALSMHHIHIFFSVYTCPFRYRLIGNSRYLITTTEKTKFPKYSQRMYIHWSSTRTNYYLEVVLLDKHTFVR